MSFVALSTDVFPYAKGEMEWRANTGTTFHVHAQVECLSITENQAWLSGPGSYEVDGEPQEGTFFFQWSVQDSGEGANSSPDMASQLFFAEGPQDCHLRNEPPIFAVEGGNIQVREQ